MALKPHTHHSRTIQSIRKMPQARTAYGARRCFLNRRIAAAIWVRPFTASNTKPEGTKSLKKTSGQGILSRSIANNGSPPHDTPDGSIHIITAPATAPMPINRVSIFWRVFNLRVYYSISQILSSLMIFGADFPASTNTFSPFL